MAERPYWFAAKRYGWGWGLPSAWQGWAVLACYFALVALGLAVFPARTESHALIAYLLIVTALLVAVCWLKGEPPRWRWGDDT